MLVVLLDQSAYSRPIHFRRADQVPDLRPACENGFTYIELPRQQPLLAQPQCPADRSQPAPVQHGHRRRQRATSYPWRYGDAARKRQLDRRDPAAAGAIAPRTFGKCHETPPYVASVSGPFDLWPTRQRLREVLRLSSRGEQSLFASDLDRWHHLASAFPVIPDYHFNVDITKKAIDWVHATRSLTPDRPFFMYYAAERRRIRRTLPLRSGSTSTLQGRVRPGLGQTARGDPRAADQDGHRAARHKARCEPAEIAAWDTLSADEKKVLSPADGSVRDADGARRS